MYFAVTNENTTRVLHRACHSRAMPSRLLECFFSMTEKQSKQMYFYSFFSKQTLGIYNLEAKFGRRKTGIAW